MREVLVKEEVALTVNIDYFTYVHFLGNALTDRLMLALENKYDLFNQPWAMNTPKLFILDNNTKEVFATNNINGEDGTLVIRFPRGTRSASNSLHVVDIFREHVAYRGLAANTIYMQMNTEPHDATNHVQRYLTLVSDMPGVVNLDMDEDSFRESLPNKTFLYVIIQKGDDADILLYSPDTEEWDVRATWPILAFSSLVRKFVNELENKGYTVYKVNLFQNGYRNAPLNWFLGQAQYIVVGKKQEKEVSIG